MKIAHINMFYYPTFGGVEKVMQELAERQVQQGHEVHVFCCDSDKYSRIKLKEEIINGVKIHRYPYWFRLSLNTFIWPSLLWNLPKYKFDIVHTHVSGHLYILFTGIVAKLKKFKYIHTTHCPWTDSKFRPFVLRPFLFLNDLIFNRISFSMVDKIIAITPWEIPILKKFTKESKIKVIPNGMDNILFKKVTPNNFKKNHNLSSPLILFFGRLNPTKGPENLAKAAVELTKEGHKINFVWVGPDEGKAEEVVSIIKDYKKMKYLGPIKGKKNIAEMYQASDLFVMPSYREGLPLCCHPDTLIETERGIKEISKIRLNEKVLTHTGNFYKVNKIFKRKINEEIVCIKPYGINQEIEITKEHPVLAIKRPSKRYKKSLGESIIESKPQWIKSQDLRSGDCVVFPIPKYESSLNHFDLANFDSSLDFSNDQIWYKTGFSGKNRENSYSSLMKETGETKKVIEEAVKYLKYGHLTPKSKRIKKILEVLKKNNFKISETNRYPRFIKIDDRLAYVFGWYITEGSTGNGFIRFAMNKKEIEYAKKIDDIMFKKFNIKGKISIENNVLNLVFCGKILEQLFSTLCGKGCRNKRIPKEFFNKKLLPSLINGLFLGDGHFNKLGWTLTTTSKQLANDVMLALLILRKKFHFHKPKRDIFVINYKPNNHNISHSNKSWFSGNNLYFMIRTIRNKKYMGDVYNLEVENDNSYTTSGFCVHNCLFEAMASGLPIIASPVNGIPFEMKEPENGLFVDYGDIEGLKKSILKLLNDRKLSKKISENNIKKSKQYNWDIIYKRYMDEYQKLCS